MAVITVSKETGCGEEVCSKIAACLEYRLINKEMVSYVAALGNMPQSDAEKFDDRNYSRLRTILAEYLDLSLFSVTDDSKPSETYYQNDYMNTPSGDNFQKAAEKVIRLVGIEGNSIIVGRGGSVILKDMPNTLHIRLVAPLKMRAENIMKSMSMSYEKAEKYAIETDNNKSAYVKRYFNTDISDMANYHLQINLGKMSTEQASETIMCAVREMESGK